MIVLNEFTDDAERTEHLTPSKKLRQSEFTVQIFFVLSTILSAEDTGKETRCLLSKS